MTLNFCKTSISCLGLILFLSISSCKPDKKDLCTISMASISATYKLTALKYKASATTQEQDYMFLLDACERDDLVTLSANGTYTYKDAGTICTPDGDDSGTWSLNGNVITSDGIVNGTVENFDCSTMLCKVAGYNTPGDQLLFTFSKQ